MIWRRLAATSLAVRASISTAEASRPGVPTPLKNLDNEFIKQQKSHKNILRLSSPAGQQCLSLYRLAAQIFAGQGRLRFFLRPKLHALDELLLAALTERYNPRLYQCYAEEDFLGLLKPLALRAVAATSRVFETAMLKRYLLRWPGK